MKALAFLALAIAASGLTACGSIAKNAPPIIDAIDKAYERCERDVTYQLQAGAMNPGSGLMVTGKYHCLPKVTAPDPAPAPAATPTSGG
jgi:hypothetical protein